MPKKRLSMRKIRELLRLKYELRRSHREIATSLGIANSTVSDYARRAAASVPLGRLHVTLEQGKAPNLANTRTAPIHSWIGKHLSRQLPVRAPSSLPWWSELLVL